MNSKINFFTVIIANSEAARLDDFKMAKKVSCVCDENNIPILNETTGYPVFVQEVTEYKGRMTHRRLCLEDGMIVLESMRQAVATAKAAYDRKCSMPKALELWKKEQEEIKNQTTEIKSVLGAKDNLVEIYEVLKSIKCSHHKTLENPAKLKARVIDTIKKGGDDGIAAGKKLRALGFNSEVFCEAWEKYNSPTEVDTEEPLEDLLADF